VSKLVSAFLGVAFVVGAVLASGARADDPAVARVNGKAVTDGDLKLAEAEIGSDLGSLAGVQRRRVLAEFLIETQLLADAAREKKIAPPPAQATNKDYWERRGLRDAFFEQVIAGGVDEKEVKAFYDENVGSQKPEDEVKARHILVDTKQKALELSKKIKDGADFAELAKQNSGDPGSKDQGGDLGFFVRGQMVPQFEEAAFSLKPGEVSEPFETQFGWHIVKVDTRRERKVPPFEAIKDRLKGAVIHYKAQQLVLELRSKAKIEYLDPEIKKITDAERPPAKN
jgi:peptidyl-prolyl cis-trans isomerase C